MGEELEVFLSWCVGKYTLASDINITTIMWHRVMLQCIYLSLYHNG